MNKITTDIISTTGINIQKYDILPAKVFVNNIEITDVNSWNKVINSIDEKQEEIERLNNIINELEKTLLEKIEAIKTIKDMLGEEAKIVNPHIEVLETEYKYFLDKLKELKENNK